VKQLAAAVQLAISLLLLLVSWGARGSLQMTGAR
jgi:hypothetical protein